MIVGGGRTGIAEPIGMKVRHHREFVSGHYDAASSVGERVDADDTIVAFTPRIPPHMQPFANTSSEPSTGRTTSRVLGSGVFFLPNDGVSCEKKERKVRSLGQRVTGWRGEE